MWENTEKLPFFQADIWPDWGNTAWADMAGLGSIELNHGTVGVCLGGLSEHRGVGDCLHEGSYPLPNYWRHFSGLSAPTFSLTTQDFKEFETTALSSNFFNAKLYAKVTPFCP